MGLTRQEANLKIADILKSRTSWKDEIKLFEELATKYPQQRAGQIVCNYMCEDYRSPDPCETTRMIMEFLFPEDPDPFFEESVVTLKRLTSK